MKGIIINQLLKLPPLKGVGWMSELLVFQGERGICLCLPWLAQTLTQERPQTTPAIFLCLFSSSFPSSKLFLLQVFLLLVPLSPLRPDSFTFFFLFSLVRQVYPLTPFMCQALPLPAHACLTIHYRQLFSSSHYLFLSSFLFSAYSSALFSLPFFFVPYLFGCWVQGVKLSLLTESN